MKESVGYKKLLNCVSLESMRRKSDSLKEVNIDFIL